ncbi:MAG TPA: BON domain-containing protein, partial [Blastocatellia bacterium]|nr:BON domain-containing protein [Blastocatellia bacterium]
MKKIMMAVLSLLLTSTPAFVRALPNGPEQSNDSAMKKERAAKVKSETAPKSDEEITRCIVEKLSNSEKLRPQGFSAKVSQGEATLTGQAQNAGSKGAATRIAQSCGARSVKNNINAPLIPRPKKGEEKRPEPVKKS